MRSTISGLPRAKSIDQHLVSLGAKLSKNDTLQRYGRTEADPDDPEDAPLSSPQPQPGLGGFANEVPTPSSTRPLADEQPTLSNPTAGEPEEGRRGAGRR